MRVALGTFAHREIRRRFGEDIAAGVQAALEHYARRLESASAPVEVPRFLRDQQEEAIAAKVEVIVELGIRETLEPEAHRSGVPIERLAVHAVFVYLADLDRASEKKLAPPSRRMP